MSSLRERREEEVTAKNEVDEARANLDLATRRLGGVQAALRGLQAERRKTVDDPDGPHAKVDRLRAAAVKQAAHALNDWLPSLLTNEPVPPAPGPEAATALLAARDDAYWEMIHEAIDTAAADPRIGAFTARTSREIDAEIVEQREAIEQLRADVRAAQHRLDLAKGLHGSAVETSEGR